MSDETIDTPWISPELPEAPQPPITATPASEWRRVVVQGELYTLPGSGNVARLRRPSLVALTARIGNVPNKLLSPRVMNLIGLDANVAATAEEQIQSFKNNAQAFLEIAQLCLVEPRLVLKGEPNYDNGEIGPGDLADRDLTWLYFSFVEGHADETLRFRVGGGPRTS